MSENIYPKLLVFLQFGLIAVMIFMAHYILSLIPMLLFLLGMAIGIWALTHNQLGNFNIEPKLKEGSKLVTSGIYRWVRHPMYSSVILMMLAVLLSSPSLIELLLFISLVLVLFLKAKREEKLWGKHDKAYLEYKKHTKLFIPYIL